MPGAAEQPHGSVKVRGMEYRGKQYSVVQGLDTMWKWSVRPLSAKRNRARQKAMLLALKLRNGRSTERWLRKSSACDGRNERDA
jgi:hypothetical protein